MCRVVCRVSCVVRTGEGEDVVGGVAEAVLEQHAQQAAHEGAHGGGELRHHRLAPREAALEQNSKVTCIAAAPPRQYVRPNAYVVRWCVRMWRVCVCVCVCD